MRILISPYCLSKECLLLSGLEKQVDKEAALYHLISPSRGVEKWISEGWDLLHAQERAEIEERIQSLFKEGLPFQLAHDKAIYLYIFTLLSQLEIVALQLPLKTLPHLKDKKLKQLMRQQLVDEVFHAILFSKIACELSVPFGYPPEYSQCIENICVFIREEQDVGAAIVLLNLIAESWFEELLDILSEKGVAPKVFEVIIEDERRHVNEAELYREIGLPDKKYLKERIAYFENELIGDLVFQLKYSAAMMHVLGRSGCVHFVHRIYEKHKHQLAKIDLLPHEKWETLMSALIVYLDNDNFSSIMPDDSVVEASSTRRIMMNAWKPPVNPTMFSLFSLDVSRVEVFENKYPPQTLTGLVLQAMSKLNKENPSLRNYVVHNKIYNSVDNYIHLVVNLPGATNHLAMLKLKNSHELTLYELSDRVQNYIQVMSYARYKSEELAEEYPGLLADYYTAAVPDSYDAFRYIELPGSIISLTNVGPWAGEQSLSPLLPFESLKLTMSQVDKKQIWNNKIKTFEIQDRLPIGLSADHRVFDANMGTPKMLQIALDEMIDKLEQNGAPSQSEEIKAVDMDQFVEFSNKMLEKDLKWGFRYLMGSSHCWQSDIDMNLLHKRVCDNNEIPRPTNVLT
jgi:hypothetical protein